MTTITTRAGKGSPLTNTELDNNFTNLNTAKYESGDNISVGTLSSGVQTIAGSNSTGVETSLLSFKAGTDALGSIRTYNGGGYNQYTRFYNGDGAPGSSEKLAFQYNYTSVVFNAGSYDQDFRVESDSDTHMLFVDAGNGRIGVRESSPEAYLHISGMAASSASAGAIFEGSWPWLKFLDTELNQDTYSIYNDNALIFTRLAYADRAGAPRAVDAGGVAVNHFELRSTENVFNNESNSIDFRVESDNDTHALFVDAGNNRVGIKTADPTGAYALQLGSQSGTSGEKKTLFLSMGGRYSTDSAATNQYQFAGFIGTTFSGTDVYTHTSGEVQKNFYMGLATDNAYFNNNRFVIVQGGQERFKINGYGSPAVIINEGGVDADFRVESDTNTHALFVDASANEVGINQSNPLASLHVNDGAIMSGGWIRTQYLEAVFPTLVFNSTYATGSWGGIGYDSSNDNMDFWVGATSENISADNSKRVLRLRGTDGFIWNDTGENNLDFRVESDGQSQMLFVDAQQNEVHINGDYGGAGKLNITGDFRQKHYSQERMYHRWTDHRSVGDGTYAGYLLLVPTHNAPGTGSANAEYIKMLFGEFYCTRASVSGGNSWGYCRVSISTGYTNDSGYIVEKGGNDSYFTKLSKVLYAGEEYWALDFGSSGGGPAHGILFTGSVRGQDSNFLFMARDTEVTVVQQPFAPTAIETGYSGAVTINRQGFDRDFRVAGDGNSHALYVDASGDRVCAGAANGSNYGARFMSSISGGSSSATIACVNTTTSGTRRQIDFFDGSSTSRKGSIETNGTATYFNTTSDRRLKDNIEPIVDGTEKLMAMKPVTHTWKAEPDAPAVHGFVAQEMQEIVPEAVSGAPDGEEMMAMDYGRITPVLVAALQDAHKKIAELEARLTELEGK